MLVPVVRCWRRNEPILFCREKWLIGVGILHPRGAMEEVQIKSEKSEPLGAHACGMQKEKVFQICEQSPKRKANQRERVLIFMLFEIEALKVWQLQVSGCELLERSWFDTLSHSLSMETNQRRQYLGETHINFYFLHLLFLALAVVKLGVRKLLCLLPRDINYIAGSSLVLRRSCCVCGYQQ